MKQTPRRVRRWAYLIIFLLLILTSFSRPWYEPKPQDLAISEPLGPYLSAQEAGLVIRPGLEKQISWAGAENQKTPWALAYLHGLSASRKELSPTIENVAGSLGANVFWQRLTAHGMDGEAFSHLTADDFIKDGEESVQILTKLGTKRALIGTSTGASIALVEALWHPEELEALVLISPNLGPQKRSAWLLGGPLGPYLGRIFVGAYHSYRPKTAAQDLSWTTRYRVEGLTAMMDLVNALGRMPIQKLRVPCLILMTHQDQVIDTDRALRVLEKIPKEVCTIKWITAEDHVLAGDVMSPSSTDLVTQEILAFLQSLSPK